MQILLIQLFLGYLLSLWRVAWLLNVDVPDWVDVQLIRVDGSHVIRHYDITGKQCPLWFVESKDAWKQFREDVQASLSTS